MSSQLRMSALNAVVAVHKKHHEEPDIPLERLVEVLCSGIGSEASFDYRTALEILRKHPHILDMNTPLGHPNSRTSVLRETIASIIRQERPRWTRTITLGRAVVFRTVSDQNAKQCLQSAQLFADEETAFSWWDSLASEYRQDTDDRKIEIGRRGERLTIEYEKQRLQDLGQNREPKWPGREDTTLGYDVTSFDLFGDSYQDIYIEAKACSGSNLTFHVTRNEWKIAKQRPERYRFYVWALPAEDLTVITPAQMEAHIPENQGNGEWEVAEIRWP